jgi:hypothetical protein
MTSVAAYYPVQDPEFNPQYKKKKKKVRNEE